MSSVWFSSISRRTRKVSGFAVHCFLLLVNAPRKADTLQNKPQPFSFHSFDECSISFCIILMWTTWLTVIVTKTVLQVKPLRSVQWLSNRLITERVGVRILIYYISWIQSFLLCLYFVLRDEWTEQDGNPGRLNLLSNAWPLEQSLWLKRRKETSKKDRNPGRPLLNYSSHQQSNEV